MPPKKVAVDKTFGMKNKNKSAKVQKDVSRMKEESSRKGKTPDDIKKEQERDLLAKRKKDEAKRAKEELELFKPAQVQKVPFGVDPKTVLCQFYKAGHCEKGNKCKFSHDKNIERKVDKANMYEDVRDTKTKDKEDKLNDTMDTWTDEKLASVVLSKKGNQKTTTDIVCKHFIQAIEDEKYGWFWECPNGLSCFYRHALPPGYVLNSERKKKEAAAKQNTITLEEFLESERHKLGANLTPVTAESFAKWKQTRMDKKTAEEDAAQKLKATAGAQGKTTGMSGRDLFTFNADWFEESDSENDGDEFDFSQYRRDEDEESEDGTSVDEASEAVDKLDLADAGSSNGEPQSKGKEKEITE